MQIFYIIVAVVITLVITAAVTYYVTVSNLKKNAESKIGNAESKAREIIDDALKKAETTKKEALLEVKEESIKTKNELEKETKERRAELQRYEKRVLAKEEAVDKRSEVVEHREMNLAAKEEQIKEREAKADELNRQRVQELERISGLTSEQAKAEEEKKAKISNVEVGLVTEGTVESLQPYGAFVNLGEGISGLVHISQISEKRIKHPSAVLNVGDKVKVKVIAIKDGKLSLSMKALNDVAAEEIHEETIELPESEELTTTLGSLFANIKLD